MFEAFDLQLATFKANQETTSLRLCADCNAPYRIGEGVIYCLVCGEEQQVTIDNSNQTEQQTSFIPFKFVGKGSRKYQLSLLQTSADADVHKINTERRTIKRLLYQAEHRVAKNIPDEIIKMFNQIKLAQKKVFRGGIRKGVMAMCLLQLYKPQDKVLPLSELKKILLVEDKFLLAATVYGQPEWAQQMLVAYLKHALQYLYSQKEKKVVVDAQFLVYLSFLEQLVPQIKKMRSCDLLMASAVSLFILAMRTHMDLDQPAPKIADFCKIKAVTLLKHARAVYQQHSDLHQIFKDHQILMPLAWAN